MTQITPKNFKPVNNSVAGADTQALCRVKWHHLVRQDSAGTDVSTATLEVQANLIEVLVNAAGDADLNSYTGATGAAGQVVFADGNVGTVQNLIDVINGVGTGQTAFRRLRAGLADFRPQFVIGAGDGLVTAAANILLGEYEPGLVVLADSSGLATANQFSLGLGVDLGLAGAGQQIPDHFESGYTSTTAGVETPVREAARRQAEQPGLASFQVYLTDIVASMDYANNDKLITVFDDAGNTLFTELLGANDRLGKTTYSIDDPICVSTSGSPLWIEVTGTGALTDGAMSVHGYARIA